MYSKKYVKMYNLLALALEMSFGKLPRACAGQRDYLDSDATNQPDTGI